MNTVIDTLAMEPPPTYTAVAPPDAAITGRIHLIRGQKVMLDRDLAELYGVEVRRLKEQVRRNNTRFPEDFMFELTLEEAKASRSQNATLKEEGSSRSPIVPLKRGHNIKYLPFAFTEHGILMLANVLRSEQAIAVSIHIIRVFNRMREVMLSQQDILHKLEQLENRTDGHDVDIAAILRVLRELTERPAPPRRPLGFKPQDP
jgi:phage regulator Rha-like protein